MKIIFSVFFLLNLISTSAYANKTCSDFLLNLIGKKILLINGQRCFQVEGRGCKIQIDTQIGPIRFDNEDTKLFLMTYHDPTGETYPTSGPLYFDKNCVLDEKGMINSEIFNRGLTWNEKWHALIKIAQVKTSIKGPMMDIHYYVDSIGIDGNTYTTDFSITLSIDDGL